jgi:hypothetical protein
MQGSEAMNETPREMKVYETLAACGFVTAAVCAIFYFMRLPIFDATAVSWFFVVGLFALAIAVLALVIRNIWSQP